MTPATAHSEAGEPSWPGGPIFQADLGNVQHVVKTGDFEGVVGVGIVLTQGGIPGAGAKGPEPLVIDVAH